MRQITGLIFLLFSLSLNATTYHLDATNGSNANDGLTPATAWKDLFKIREGLGPQPGDTYLFKRGEAWLGTQLYITASGTTSNPIRYNAYGAGPPPIISVISKIENADNPAAWTQVTTNRWSFTLDRTPGRLFLDGSEFLRSSTLDSLGNLDNEGAIGRWYYENNTLYIHNTQNPALAFSTIAGSKLFNTVLLFGATNVEIHNLDIQGGSGASLSINGGSDITIANCHLGAVANSGVTIIDATVDNLYTTSKNVVIENNNFDSKFIFFYGLGSERGCGDGVKLFYGVEDCIIRNNNFINWAHNAIELLANIPGRSGVRNNLFHNNSISAPDIPYAHPLGVDGLLGLCEFNEFYRNTISDCRTASQVNGNNNHVHHNIIVGMRKSPSKNQATAHSFSIGIYGTDLVSQNNRFDHNLIIDTDESAFLIRGYGFAGQAFGHQIRNNIFYDTGLSPYQPSYPLGAGIVIFDTADDGVGPNTFQNNLFYSSISSARAVYLQDSDSYLSAEEFNDQNGNAGNIIMENIAADPLFRDFNGGDYFPSDMSPAINAAINTDLTLDYSQNPRIVGSAPDIGPYETAITVLPATWTSFTVNKNSSKTLMLEWSTSTESNTRSFTVERSQDAIRWQSLGEIPAAQSSSILTSYQYIDEPPTSGIWYYRIKQIDQDHQFNYSSIESGTLEEPLTFYLTRLDKHTLKVNANIAPDWSTAKFHLYDTSGRLLMHQQGNPIISIAEFPEGMLYLAVAFPNGQEKTLMLIH